MSMHAWFILAVVAFILSLMSMVLMRCQRHYSKAELICTIGWYGFAILTGFLLLLGTGFTAHTKNGYGNPNHPLGWIVGGFVAWLFLNVVIYKATKKINNHANPSRH